MEIPRRKTPLAEFCKELVEQCNYSRASRATMYTELESLYRTGSGDGVPAKYNKAYSHADKLSSLVYSPADVRFTLEFEDDAHAGWATKCRVASKHLNRQFRRRRVHTSIAPAVEMSYYLGASLFKVIWSSGGYSGSVVHPKDFGVYNEGLTDLSEQEAFCHTMRISKFALARLLYQHPDKDELLARVMAQKGSRKDQQLASSYEVFANGVGQLQTNGQAGTGKGNALLSGAYVGPTPSLAPETDEQLIDMHELWVQDDERQDWTTLRYIEPGIVVEGVMRHRNLCDAPHNQPFTKFQPKETPGYFWGESCLARVRSLQQLLNKRLDQVDSIWGRQANPPKVVTGMTVSEEKLLALLAPGGSLVDSDPGGKVTELKPELPQGSLEYIKFICDMYDDAGGINAALSGAGEQGVRSGNHGQQQLRMSGPRLRDASIEIETQVANVGQLCFEISQAKNATIFKDELGDEFLLDQIPDDASVAVDSHTTSPIFVGDNLNLAFALRKSEAIDNEDLLEMTHPARTEELIEKLHAREKQKQQFIEQHPEVLDKRSGRRA